MFQELNVLIFNLPKNRYGPISILSKNPGELSGGLSSGHVDGKITGGGFPMGAFAGKRKHERFGSRNARSTFGGPLASAVGNAVLDIVENEAWNRTLEFRVTV